MAIKSSPGEPKILLEKSFEPQSSYTFRIDDEAVSALNVQAKEARPTLGGLSITKNSRLENVIRWSISSTKNTQTFIIFAEYFGFAAPIGAVPCVQNATSYSFVDDVLCAYVGKKVYGIATISNNGTITLFPNL
jgi:hypothetical protein